MEQVKEQKLKQTKIKNIELNFKLLGKYSLLLALFFLFNKASVFGVVLPCFYGFYLTLLFLGENIIFLSVSYFIACVLCGINLPRIIFCILLAFFGGLIRQGYKKVNKLMPLWQSGVYGLVFGLIYALFNVSLLETFYISIINAVFNAVFMVCTINVFSLIKNRNYNLNFNVDEIVCACTILAFVFCGLESVNNNYFNLIKFVGFLVILFSLNVFKNNFFTIVLGVVMGLGVTLNNGNLEYVSLLSCISIFCYVFRENKYYCAIAGVSMDLVFSLFILPYNEFSYFTILPGVVASIIYLVTPKKVLQKLENNLYLNASVVTLKNILNQNKLQVSKKLLYTSQVFYEMDKNFRSMVKGNLDVKNAKLLICNEVIKCNCESCSEKTKCLKSFNSELKKIFENLVNIGFEKGKITLVDLPTYLTNRCGKLNQVINTMNNLLTEYKSYTKMLGDLDASKVLIAEQLSGIAGILYNLADETKINAVTDEKQEEQIKEVLTYNNIITREVVCFEKDEKTNSVSIIVRSCDFNNEKITNVLSNFFKTKMIIDQVLLDKTNNLTYASYKTAPTYDIALGIAQSAKGGQDVCGDTHSTTKLIGDKFLFALCDGMGHGENANNASTLSLNLIENFYKAGFDDGTILESVNKLLNINSQETFSALDIGVVDLKNGEIDFIKQGATISFVKSGDKVFKIETNSLPIGILDEIKPKVTKTIITPEDYVIMISDGIVEAFGEEETLKNFLKNMAILNPQEVADRILTRAKKAQKNYPEDDMTVMVAKLFYNFA